MFKEPSPLWKVKCKKCGHEQIVYSKPSNEIKCLKCSETIIVPTGGKGKLINCEIVEVIK
jgi:ribosomal protein S27E